MLDMDHYELAACKCDIDWMWWTIQLIRTIFKKYKYLYNHIITYVMMYVVHNEIKREKKSILAG